MKCLSCKIADSYDGKGPHPEWKDLYPGYCWSCSFGADLSERRRPKTDENGLPDKKWLKQLELDIEYEKECGNNDLLVQTLDLLVKTAYIAWNKTALRD